MSSTSGPPASPFDPQYFGSNAPSPPNSSTGSFSPAVIAIIGILGAAFLLVSYYTVVAKFCSSRGVFRRRRGRNPGEAGEHNEAALPMLTQGLEESVIQAIPVCVYSKSEGLVDGSDCAVCLSEFQEQESLRLLPKCSHAFHLPCIDKWLQSHSNCPLCRANIKSPVPTPPAMPVPTVPTADGETAAEVSQSLGPQEAGSSNSSLQRSSNQRSSEPTSDDLRSHMARLSENMSAEELETLDALRRLKALNREHKIDGRYADGLLAAGERIRLGGFRCFSTGRALKFAREERTKDFQESETGDGMMMERSCSLGSHSTVLGNMLKVHLCEDLDRQLAWHHRLDEAADSAHLPPNAGVNLILDVDKTGSSSSHGTPMDFKSRSLNHDTGVKNKAEMGDPLVGRMLLSLEGPLAVKRSFSGGRLFGFKVRNTVGTENTRLPI